MTARTAILRPSAHLLLERWDYFLAPEVEGLVELLFAQAADEVGAEEVIADPLLALLQLLDHCFGAADDGEAVVDVELVVGLRPLHGLTALEVIGAVAVGAHASDVRAPADACRREGAAADASLLGGADVFARRLVRLFVRGGDV